MAYTKIRLDFEYGPKGRFYRVVLVKGNPDLYRLGVYFGSALGATFEHAFMITSKKRDVSYVPAAFMEDPFDGYKYLGKYHLSDLEDNFRFEYDTGDGWDFLCKRYKKTVELDSEQDIIILEGKGQGIWEDNIGTLYGLFDGTVNPNSTRESDKKGIYKPWNFEIKRFGDFDLPLNIKELNEELKSADDTYDEMIEEEKEYIEENEVCLEDYSAKDKLLLTLRSMFKI